MKSKSCVQCRQRKARCEYDGDRDEGCRRCRSLGMHCVYDASYQRAAKGQVIQRMASEIDQLRQALDRSRNSTPQAASLVSLRGPDPLLLSDTTPSEDSYYRTSNGEVSLLPAQAKEHFQFYFLRCHSHLPFVVRSQDPRLIWKSCPVLFWAIVNAAAGGNWGLRTRLATPLRAMLAETLHAVPRTVEMVQALLVMATWPLPVPNISRDASDFYCAFATQMALSLGLHRNPAQAHVQTYRSEEQVRLRDTDPNVKTSTWNACFVASQQQFLYRGVPQQVWLDRRTVEETGNGEGDAISRACRLHHTFMQANLAIGDGASTDSGMLEPTARIIQVKSWILKLDGTLEPSKTSMTDELMVSLLAIRMQLWSYGILDDVPLGQPKLECARGAEDSATSLIRLARTLNLATAPSSVRRAVAYSGMILVKILRSALSSTGQEVLQDSIEYVRQGLRSTTECVDDHWHKASETIPALIYLEDRGLSAPIYSRMGASLIYDLLRIWEENKIASTQNVEGQDRVIDLDGFDWDQWIS